VGAGGIGACVYDLAYRLGAGKIGFAVRERTKGKLAFFRRPEACRHEKAEYREDDGRAAVTGDFHRVLAGKAFGRPVHRQHHFVHLAVVRGGVDEPAVHEGSPGRFEKGPGTGEAGREQFDAAGAGRPYDTERGRHEGGRDGGHRIVERIFRRFHVFVFP